MEVTIFKEITTEGVISSIEENSKKYHVGFYGDMNNAPERKLIKESAAEIGGIIKELEAARIRITKANTLAVNKEHKAILDRLKLANEPFTVLIDEYNAQRKRELAILKACEDAKQAAIQLEYDHEFALLMNSTYEHDKAEETRFEQEQEKQAIIDRDAYAAEQVRLATMRQSARLKQEVEGNAEAENARLANVDYCARVNRTALNDLIDNCELTPTQARIVVESIVRNKISNVKINY